MNALGCRHQSARKAHAQRQISGFAVVAVAGEEAAEAPEAVSDRRSRRGAIEQQPYRNALGIRVDGKHGKSGDQAAVPRQPGETKDRMPRWSLMLRENDCNDDVIQLGSDNARDGDGQHERRVIDGQLAALHFLVEHVIALPQSPGEHEPIGVEAQRANLYVWNHRAKFEYTAGIIAGYRESIMKCFVILLFLLGSVAFAQEQKPAAPPVSPSARLAAAKTAYVKSIGDSETPFNVIQSGLEGWPRFILVDSAEKADVVIQIETKEDENGVSVSSDSGGKKTRINHDINVTEIKLTVYDAKTHLPLYTAVERPKGGFKDKTREDNLVKASQDLLQKFRDRMEPLPKSDAAPKTS